YVADVPVSGEVVLVEDGIEESSTSDACEEILNTSELAGKIALIDRGSCMFSLKALRAQNAGAIGVIICNYNDEQYGAMFPGDYGADIQIPVVLISAKSSQVIRQYIGKGLKVSLVKTDQNAPLIYDVCLDNGIIAHEYGHGISWRLAGGPSLVCLDNQEQMDEGWSDFFGLVTTVKPGDTGANPRGLGGYLTDEQGTNGGIRRFPYSTDMNLNPLTYGYISNSKTLHDMGEVWASTLWDMYWALSDKYGWSANPYDETSGNNKAVRLVFDGLKNLPCNPGFLDGRNAILAADEALNNGENACLIWSVFARRGMGYSADQGSPFSAGDQKEAFDVLPVCAGKMLIEKSVTGFIQPGEEIQVTIGVGNFRQETATNVVVTDEIPAGTAFKPGSSNFPATVQGNTIAFNLGNMNFKEESTITYTLETDPKAWSKRKFLDEVPDKSGANWRTYTIGDMAPNFWAVTDEFPAHSGNFAWNSKEIQTSSRQALELNPDAYTFHAEGERPTLRFYHRYQTTTILSGGIVEAREVGSSTWQQLGDDMLRNGYPCFVHYQTFGLPNLRGFSGNSGAAFKASYVDLSKWAGKNIQLRFRMGTVDLDEPTANAGWLIDDIEFMDLLTYNGEACVKSDQGDIECAVAPEAGTIVDSKAELVEVEDQLNEYTLKIYPNPASDRITAALSVAGKQRISISVLSLDGRTLFSKPLDVTGNEYLDIDTSLLPSGLYFVKIDSREGSLVRKVAIQK
ncbi:MAG: M36 family metallopeptidase, partial [Thermoanaerobaculia bacterium]|nr:M36 family metallopeptidase [Thermoanaerobaculia bacterium]